MNIILNQLSHNLNLDKYFRGLNSCFIDIETTGLSGKHNNVYLIGLLFYDYKNEIWILKQYFANNLEEEKNILKKFIFDLSIFDNLITYNGEGFDIPFINHRLKVHNIEYNISLSKSYDLYKLIKDNKHFLNLENLKLKTIERSLGYFREDIYSGFDCIKFYHDYMRSSNLNLKEKILKHNSDDLFYMLDIINIIDVINDKKTINLNSNSNSFTIYTINIVGDILYVSGFVHSALENNIKIFSNYYDVSTEDFKTLNISIYIRYGYVSKEEKCMYVDSLDYPDMNLSSYSKYNLPPNVFILKVEKELYLDNIKILLQKILEDII